MENTESNFTKPEVAALLHVVEAVDMELPESEGRGKLYAGGRAGCAGLDGATHKDLESLRILLDEPQTLRREPDTRGEMPVQCVLGRSEGGVRETRSLIKQDVRSEKAAKKRAKWRRQYKRKMNRLTDLREQVAALEAEMHSLERNSELSATEIDSLGDCDETADRKLRLAGLLRSAAQAKVELQLQNSQLLKSFRANLVTMKNLRQALDAEHKLYLANSSYFVVLKPLTLPDCKSILRSAMEEVSEFVENNNSVPSCGEICGWDKRWLADSRDFRYSVRKTLRGQSATHILDQTWKLLVNPSAFEKLFTPRMNMRVRLVQKVDDDNLIFLQENSAMDADNDLVVESDIVLVSKLVTESGPSIMLRGLDRSSLPVRDKLEPLSHGRSANGIVHISSPYLCWMELRQVQGDCSMVFYGAKSTVWSTSCFWAAEVVQVALRWEFSVFGSKFSLPKEN